MFTSLAAVLAEPDGTVSVTSMFLQISAAHACASTCTWAGPEPVRRALAAKIASRS